MRYLEVVEIEDLTPRTALCCLAWGHLVKKIVIKVSEHSDRLWGCSGFGICGSF